MIILKTCGGVDSLTILISNQWKCVVLARIKLFMM